MSEPSTTPSLTPPTPTPRSENLDPMEQMADRAVGGTSYPQSGSPYRGDEDKIDLGEQSADGNTMEIDERSNTTRQPLTLLPPHLNHRPSSSEISPTATTDNNSFNMPIDPSLTSNPASIDDISTGEQRQSLTGPTRTHTKPAPLNLRSISNSSTLQNPGPSMAAGHEASSPYAGQYAQRLERRTTQYAGQTGHAQAPTNGDDILQPATQQVSASADDTMRYPGSDRPPTRPAILAHSASLPVLPSQDAAASASPSTYAPQPYQGASAASGGQNYARAYSYGYGQGGGEPSAGSHPGAGHDSSTQAPPPFSHAYSSPAAPMYAPGPHGHHYHPSGYPHVPTGYAPHGQHHSASGYQQYPPQQHYQGQGAPMASPSFLGSAAGGGYAPAQSSSATGNTPGVLVIGANGQIMPHNAAQMVGGRGTPLSERPFKCDECVQSFNRNHDLKRHKRIHLAVKPFACEKCGKQFSRKDALRRHWLVKGCKASDDPNVNMTNPAYRASKTSSASPSDTTPSALPPHPQHMQQPPQQHAYNNHPTMLRNASYGGGPMIVTPDEAYAGYNNGYAMAHTQFRQPVQPVMSANTSPASMRPSGGSMSYGAPPGRPFDRIPSSAGATFPGQLTPSTDTHPMSDPVAAGTNSKLPGRYSLDARLHTTASPTLERTDLGTRAASVSMPLTDGSNHKRTHGSVMVVQADGMIEETVPGQANSIKRMSRDDYFDGVYHGGQNGSGAMDQALDAYTAIPASQTPKSASASSPSFAMPFEKSSRQSVDASNNNGPGSEAWTRWHRPSFPFPHAGNSLYRAPDSMEDSTDLRKSISQRASVSQQQQQHQQQQGNYANGSSPHRPSPPHGQRWTRASFPFPENPDNAMGIRSGDTLQ